MMPESMQTSSIQNVSCENKIGKKNEKGLIEAASNPVVIWNKKVPNTALKRFQKYIENKYDKRFASYWEFHKWSVEHFTKFWEELWNYFEVRASKPYEKVFVKTGPGFLDNQWFVGARFNFAENVLRVRDSRVALMYLDEEGSTDTVTYEEMFEEVKLYAAAFRKSGLKTGDTVACYMSNRKEAFFAMLATTSIGAIFGGPLPYFSGRATYNVVKIMDAKFLITVDSHLCDGILEKMAPHVKIIAENCPKLEKVIVVVTKELYMKEFSNISNCLPLEDFLRSGRTPEGNVPDIIFEQLSFDHPICINFSSGTTGIPKAPVHSAGTLICHLRDFAFDMNVKSGDTLATCYPVGWVTWDYFLPSLALGVKLLLQCYNNPLYEIDGKNYWDIMAKYKVAMTFMSTFTVDRMEKMDLLPSPESNLDCLRVIAISGLPVKKEHFEYLRNKISKDVFIGSCYAATESFGAFSAFDQNLPVYAGEIQACSLGMDVHCFNSEGKSVIGQRGEMVVCTPAPCFPIGLWKDENKKRITEVYLSKYPGVWSQHDECWFNPKTNGLIVIGRSDDTLKQSGERLGSGDIYNAIHCVEELQDYICVGQKRNDGANRVVLFVKMKKGYKLTPEIQSKIEEEITNDYGEDCVPEVILEVPDIPYNIRNKRMESVVWKILETNEIPEVTNIRNPECLKHFLNIPEIMSFYDY